MRPQKLMKQFHRCTRILILSLLSVSVCLPLFLLSSTLRHIHSDGSKEYLEDLATIKHRIDVLRVGSVEQEEGEGLKEPNHVVYKHISVDVGVGNSSSYRNIKSEGSRDSIVDTSLFKTNGTNLHTSKYYQKNEEAEAFRISGRKGQFKQTNVQHEKSTQFQPKEVLDKKVKEMKDQVIKAKVYLSFSPANSNSHIVKELRVRIKELERAIGDSNNDSDLPKSAFQKMKAMQATLLRASRLYPDCSAMIKKLSAMTDNAEEQVRTLRNEAMFLVHLAGRTTPKGLHCLSMRLTSEYFALQPKERELSNQHKLHVPELYHFALFTDNILACAVVVNSTISNAMEPGKIVFHIVTDSLNLPAISMWFLLNPPGKAAIQIQSMDKFEQLLPKYDATMPKQKTPDPRYTSTLNHLRFYLPNVFPLLNKIVLLDHDVVVQKDLTRLWSVDMKGKVNGAVETCLEGEPSLHHMDMLINFSDPFVAKGFDPKTCTWAFGMNLFDLKEWRRRDLTGVYQKYLQLGNKMSLWKAGSLPLGWVTFYNQTVALSRGWHVLGLGHDSGVLRGDVEQAAVVHYDGIMKPWLDIGLEKYKPYWKKYVKYDHSYLQQCNIHA